MANHDGWFRRNPISGYGLGRCIPRTKVRPYLHRVVPWWTSTDLIDAVSMFVDSWDEYGFLGG